MKTDPRTWISVDKAEDSRAMAAAVEFTATEVPALTWK
jgi:hypothetical protein